VFDGAEHGGRCSAGMEHLHHACHNEEEGREAAGTDPLRGWTGPTVEAPDPEKHWVPAA
jgi:hypothetical protein